MAVEIIRRVGRPTSVNAALTLWAVALCEAIQTEQQAKDFVASGDSLESYTVTVDQKAVEVSMFSYLQTSFEGVGRKPGTMPPVSDIAEWVKVKGIASDEKSIQRIAWAISIKLRDEGNAVYKKDREGIDLEALILESFDAIDDEMAMLVAQEAADKIVLNFKK